MAADRPDLIAAEAGWGGVGFSDMADVVISGADPVLPSRWPVGELAAVALAQVGVQGARLSRLAGGQPGATRTTVQAGAASVVSYGIQRLDGEVTQRTNMSNPFVARYRTTDDRWIHLHGGFPGLKERLARVLNLPLTAEATDLERVVRRWHAQDLEDLIAAEHGCSAIMRTEEEWRRHPHGSVVHSLPLVIETTGDTRPGRGWEPSPARPLDGLRVLDLTRVLAGPTCGRTLASMGADVLHVRGPNVPHVPAFVIDTGHGKRQAHCDFTDPDDLAALRATALAADVVVQGHRPGVVDQFGLDENSLRGDGFTGVYGVISAFGPQGPWSDRAGWEQLAQSTSGLCEDVLGDRRPEMLPGAITDYTTGFVLASAVMGALADSLSDGRVRRLEAALCHTAAWLVRVGRHFDAAQVAAAPGVDVELMTTATEFGSLEHVGPGFTVDGLDVGWTLPPAPLGSGALGW